MLVFSNIFTYFQEPSIDKCFCIFQVILKSYVHVYDWYIENGDYNGHMTQQPITMPNNREIPFAGTRNAMATTHCRRATTNHSGTIAGGDLNINLAILYIELYLYNVV